MSNVSLHGTKKVHSRGLNQCRCETKSNVGDNDIKNQSRFLHSSSDSPSSSSSSS